MKIRAVAGESFHADGRTDSGKLVVAFRNLADAPKYLVPVLQKTPYKEQLVGAAGGVGVGVRVGKSRFNLRLAPFD